MMRDMNLDKANVNNSPRAANIPIPCTSQPTKVSTSVQQLLQIPNDYNIRTCKKAAKIIYGEIVNSSRKRRCVMFVTEIYKQLLFLHDYNTHTTTKKKRFPFSKDLVNLLVEYVRLERDVLHYPKNFCVAYKEKVAHRVITLLEIMLCGCAKPTPPGCKFPNSLLVLHLLNMVPQNSQNNELEDIFVHKIVKKLGIFNIFEDLKNGSLLDSDIGIDRSMSIAEMMCYYGIDELNEEWDTDDENNSGGFSRFQKINLDHHGGRDLSKKLKKPPRVRVKPSYSVSATVRKKVTTVTDANSNPDLSGTMNSDVQIVNKPSVNDVKQSTKHNPNDCKKLLPNGIKFNDSPKCLLTKSDVHVQFDILGHPPCTSRASDITCFNGNIVKVKCKQLPKLISPPINTSEVIRSDDHDCDLLNDANDMYIDKDRDEDKIPDRFVEMDLSSTKEINTTKTSITTDNQVNEISSSEAYDIDNCQSPSQMPISFNLQYPSPRSDTSMHLEITSTTSYTNYPTVESGNTWASSNSPSTSQLTDNQMEIVDLNDISNDQVPTSNLSLKAEHHCSELPTHMLQMIYDSDISQQCSDTNCVDAPSQNKSDVGSLYSLPFQSYSSQLEKDALQQLEFPNYQDAINKAIEHESIENSDSRKLNTVHPDSIEKVNTEMTTLTGPTINESLEKTTLQAQFNSDVPEKLFVYQVSMKTTETQEKVSASDYKNVEQTITIEIPKDIEDNRRNAVDESDVCIEHVTDETTEDKIGHKQSETVIPDFFEQAEDFLEEVPKKGLDGKYRLDKLESIKHDSSCTSNIIVAYTNKLVTFDEPCLLASHKKDLLTNEISKLNSIRPSTPDTIDVQTDAAVPLNESLPLEKNTEKKVPIITEQSQEFVEHVLQASSDEGEVASPNQQLFDNSKESISISPTNEIPVDVIVNQPTLELSIVEQEYSEVETKDVYSNSSPHKDTLVDPNIQIIQLKKDFSEARELSEKAYVTSKIPEKMFVKEPDIFEECIIPVTTEVEVVESQKERINVNQITSKVKLETKLLVKFEEFVEKVTATTSTKKAMIQEISQPLQANAHHNSELAIKEVVTETAEDSFEEVQEEPYMHVSNYEDSVCEEPIKQNKSDHPVTSQTSMSIAFDEEKVEPLRHHDLYSEKSLKTTSKSKVVVQLPAKPILCDENSKEYTSNNTKGCISTITNETSEDGIMDQTSTVQLLCNEHWQAVTSKLEVGQEQIPDINEPLELNTPIIKKMADYDNDICEKVDGLCMLAYTAVENMEYLPVTSSTPSTPITTTINKQARSRVRIPNRQAYIEKKQRRPTTPPKARRKLPPRAAKRCIPYVSIDQQIRHIMELEEFDKQETSETKISAAVVSSSSPCIPEVHSEDSSDRLIIDEQNLDPCVFEEDTLSDNLLLVTTNSLFVEQLKKIKNKSISAILKTIPKGKPKRKTITIQNDDKWGRSKSMDESTNSKRAEVSKKKKRVSFEETIKKNQNFLNQKPNPNIDAREKSDFLEVEFKLKRKEAVNKDENIKEIINKQMQIIENDVPLQESSSQKKNSKPRSTLKLSAQNSEKHPLARNKPCKRIDIDETSTISYSKTVTTDKRISTSLKRDKINVEIDLPIEDLPIYPFAEQIIEDPRKGKYTQDKKTQHLHGIVEIPPTCCKFESPILNKAKNIFENTCDQLLRHGTEVIPMVAGYSTCQNMTNIVNADEEPLDLTSKQHKKSNAVKDKIMTIVENLPHDIEIPHDKCMEFSKTEKPKVGIEEGEDYTKTIVQEQNVIVNKLLLPVEDKHILQSNAREANDECVNLGKIVVELKEPVSDAKIDLEHVTRKRLHQEIMEVVNLSSTTKDIDTENRSYILFPEKTTIPLEDSSFIDDGMEFDVEQIKRSDEQVQLVNEDTTKTIEKDLPMSSKATTNNHKRTNKSLLLTETSNEQVLDSRLEDNTITTEEDASIKVKEVTIDYNTDFRESDRTTNEHRPDISLDHNIYMIEHVAKSSKGIVSEEPNFNISNANISDKQLLGDKGTDPPVEKENLFYGNPLKESQSPENAIPISKQYTHPFSQELNSSITQQTIEQIQPENIHEEANNITEKSIEEDMKSPASQFINSDNIKDIDTNMKCLERTVYVEEAIVKIPYYDTGKGSSTINNTQDEKFAVLDDSTPTLDNVSNFPEVTVSENGRLITIDVTTITSEDDHISQEKNNEIKMLDVSCGDVNIIQQDESRNAEERAKADRNSVVENTDTSSCSELNDQSPNDGQGTNSSTMEEDCKSNPETSDERNHEGDDLSVQSIKTKEEEVLNIVHEHSKLMLGDVLNSPESTEPDEVGGTVIDKSTVTTREVADAVPEENGNMSEESESEVTLVTNQNITDNEIVSSRTNFELVLRDEVEKHTDMRKKSTVANKVCVNSEDIGQIEDPTNMMQKDLQIASENNINGDHSSDNTISATRILNYELGDMDLEEHTGKMQVDTQITCKSLCQNRSNEFSIKRLLELDDEPNKKRHKSVIEENIKYDQEIKATSREEVTDGIYDTKVKDNNIQVPCTKKFYSEIFPIQTAYQLKEHTNISEENTDQKIDIASEVNMKYVHKITHKRQEEVTDVVYHHTELIKDYAQIACEDIVKDDHNTAPDVNLKYDQEITAIPQEEVTDDGEDYTNVINEVAQIACEKCVADDHDTAPDVNMMFDHEITALCHEDVIDDVNSQLVMKDKITCEIIVADDHNTAPDVNIMSDHKTTAIHHEIVTDDINNHSIMQIACEKIDNNEHSSNSILPTKTNLEFKEHTIISEESTDQRNEVPADVNMRYDHEIAAISHEEVTDNAVHEHIEVIKTEVQIAFENKLNMDYSVCVLPTKTSRKHVLETEVREPASMIDEDLPFVSEVNVASDSMTDVVTFSTKTSNEKTLDFIFEDYTNEMEAYCPSTAKATINTEDISDFGVFCINISSQCVHEDQRIIIQYDTHVTSKANLIMDIITDDVQTRRSQKEHKVVLEDSANMQAYHMMSSGASTSSPIPMEENTSSCSETTTMTSDEDDVKTEVAGPQAIPEHHICKVIDDPKPRTEDFIMEDMDIEKKESLSKDLQKPTPIDRANSTSRVMNTTELNALKNVDNIGENRIGYQLDCHLYYKTKNQNRAKEQQFVVPDLILESDKSVGQHKDTPQDVTGKLAIQEEKDETVAPDNTVDTIKTEEYSINSKATVNSNKSTNFSTSPIKLKNKAEVKDQIHTIQEATTMVKTINADSFARSQTDLTNKDVLDVVLEENMMEEHELFDIDIYSQVEIESATDYNSEPTLPSFLENNMAIGESLSEPNSFAKDDDEVSERLKYYISVKIADRDKPVGGPLIGSCKKNANRVQVSPEMSPTRQGSQMQYTDHEDGISSFRERSCISTLMESNRDQGAHEDGISSFREGSCISTLMESNLDQGTSPVPGDESVSVFQLSDQEHQYYNSFIGHQTPQMMQNVQCTTESNTHFIDLDLHLESRSDDIMSMMEVHLLMHPNAMANQLSPIDLPPMLTNLKQEVDTDTENNVGLQDCNSSIASRKDKRIDYNTSFPGTILPASMCTSSSTDEKNYLTNYSLSDLENISFQNDSMTPLETPKSKHLPAPVLKNAAEPQKVEVKVNEFDYASTDDMFKNIKKPDSSPKPKPTVVKKEKRLMDLVEKLSQESKKSIKKVQSNEDMSLYARRKTRPEMAAPIKQHISPLHNESTLKLTPLIVTPINKIESSSEVQIALPSKSPSQLEQAENFNLNSNVDVGQVSYKEPMLTDSRPVSSIHYQSPSQLQPSENLNLNSNVDVGQVSYKEPMLTDCRPESSMHYQTALWHETDSVKVASEEKIVLLVPPLPLLIDTPAKLRNLPVGKVAPTVRSNTKLPATNNSIPVVQYDPVIPNTYDTVKTRQRNQTNKYGSECSQTKHYQSDRGKRKSASVEHIRPVNGKSEDNKQRGDNRQRSGSLCPADKEYPKSKSKSVEENDSQSGKRRSRSKLDDPEALRIDKRQKKDMIYEEPIRPRSRPFSEERDRTGYALKMEPFSSDAHQKASPLSSTKSRYTSEDHVGNVQDKVAFKTKELPYAYDKKTKASISDKQSPTNNHGKSQKSSLYNKPSSTPYNISNSIKHSERNSKEKDSFSPSSTNMKQRMNSSSSSSSTSPTPEKGLTAEELFDILKKEDVNDHKRKVDGPYLREGSLGEKKGANEQNSWPPRSYHTKQQSYEKLNIKISQPASSSSREDPHNLHYPKRDSDGSRRNFDYSHSQNNHASSHHENHQMRPNHNQQPSRSYHVNDKGRQSNSERLREDRSHNYAHGNRHAPYGLPQKYPRNHDINYHLSAFNESLKRKPNVKDNWFEELESKLDLPAEHRQLFVNRKEK